MTRHPLRHWPLYLAFVIGLLLVDPISAGLAAVMTGEIGWGGARR